MVLGLKPSQIDPQMEPCCTCDGRTKEGQMGDKQWELGVRDGPHIEILVNIFVNEGNMGGAQTF